MLSIQILEGIQYLNLMKTRYVDTAAKLYIGTFTCVYIYIYTHVNLIVFRIVENILVKQDFRYLYIDIEALRTTLFIRKQNLE